MTVKWVWFCSGPSSTRPFRLARYLSRRLHQEEGAFVFDRAGLGSGGEVGARWVVRGIGAGKVGGAFGWN